MQILISSGILSHAAVLFGCKDFMESNLHIKHFYPSMYSKIVIKYRLCPIHLFGMKINTHCMSKWELKIRNIFGKIISPTSFTNIGVIVKDKGEYWHIWFSVRGYSFILQYLTRHSYTTLTGHPFCTDPKLLLHRKSSQFTS